MIELENLKKLISLHIANNIVCAKEYANEGNTEMVNAHIGGVSALRMLERELDKEFGVDDE